MIRLLKKMKPYRGQVVFVIILTFMQVISELFLPTLMADIVNIGIKNQDTGFIWNRGMWMTGIALVGTLAAIASLSFTKDIRKMIFMKVQSLSPGEFDQIGTSSLITRSTNDVNQVQNVVIMGLRMMVRAPLMAVGGILLAVSKNPELSLVLLVVVVLLAVVIGLIASFAMPLFKLMQKKVDNLNRVLRETLMGVRVIRAFNRTEYERLKFESANQDLVDTALKVNYIMVMVMPIIMLLLNFTNIALIWFGASRIDAGVFLIGDLMAFIQYAMQILFSVIMMTVVLIMYPRAVASAQRINEVMDIETAIKDSEALQKINDIKKIEFDNVSFRYEGAEEYALRNISFSAQKGETIGIIGSTGSGKSTMVNLIPRFFDPDEGIILVNDINLKHIPLKQLREKIGLVPQKSVLFSGTIHENISFGHEDMVFENVEKAAKIAQADEFVSKMPKSYKSDVSQGGTNLSGGQKQRLSIARAIVSPKDIYVFDDSFSALDFKTDQALRKALKSNVKESIILLVSQRVSTILEADRIIVLDKGVIVGNETHEVLLKECPTYQQIVASQITEEVSA